MATLAAFDLNGGNTMSQNIDPDFEQILKSTQRFFALFYASWCPFSRKFLPIYQKCTLNSPVPCLRIMVDDRDDLCEKYEINYYPTVLLFENGLVTSRLDAAPGEGLSENQLKKMLSTK
jgi:thiol-disulfide isomerase/thioredoxin